MKTQVRQLSVERAGGPGVTQSSTPDATAAATLTCWRIKIYNAGVPDGTRDKNRLQKTMTSRPNFVTQARNTSRASVGLTLGYASSTRQGRLTVTGREHHQKTQQRLMAIGD